MIVRTTNARSRMAHAAKPSRFVSRTAKTIPNPNQSPARICASLLAAKHTGGAPRWRQEAELDLVQEESTTNALPVPSAAEAERKREIRRRR